MKITEKQVLDIVNECIDAYRTYDYTKDIVSGKIKESDINKEEMENVYASMIETFNDYPIVNSINDLKILSGLTYEIYGIDLMKLITADSVNKSILTLKQTTEQILQSATLDPIMSLFTPWNTIATEMSVRSVESLHILLIDKMRSNLVNFLVNYFVCKDLDDDD